jgi:hypothetical protein
MRAPGSLDFRSRFWRGPETVKNPIPLSHVVAGLFRPGYAETLACQ